MSSLFRRLSFLLRLSANVRHSRLRIAGIAVAGVASGLAPTSEPQDLTALLASA